MGQRNVQVRQQVTVKINQYDLWMGVRRSRLVEVDVIERHLGLPRTSKIREQFKNLQRENTKLRQLLISVGLDPGGGVNEVKQS